MNSDEQRKIRKKTIWFQLEIEYVPNAEKGQIYNISHTAPCNEMKNINTTPSEHSKI